MNILVLYEASQTFTSTVYDHLAGFARYSRSRVFFAHQDRRGATAADLHLFDVVILHYSIRLPFDGVSEATARALEAYHGLKVLFIQDEYDFTHRAWYWIKRLGIGLVFTSVPTPSIARIYPPSEFQNVRFVNNLSGYVPLALPDLPVSSPASARPLIIGYRGRPLTVRYGRLGLQKTQVARRVRAYCAANGIRHDVEWTERARIYGARWYAFIASCRSMLGTESGSNVFDWDGSLARRIRDYRKAHPKASDADVYEAVVAAAETPGVMNQVSPRIFEAIACRTALVLVEGAYSGVVLPHRHFIPLDADGGNLPEVMNRLADGPALDEMTTRAYDDVIVSGAYSYRTFVAMVDAQIEARRRELSLEHRPAVWSDEHPANGGVSISRAPVRSPPVTAPSLARQVVTRMIPRRVRHRVRRLMLSVLGAQP